MSGSRLDRLLQFYHDEPGDPFNLYALALEYLKHDHIKSLEFFNTLLTEHPDYLPAYYHAAKLYQDIDQKNLAISTYEKGIALARKKNDHKTVRELQSAYDELIYE